MKNLSEDKKANLAYTLAKKIQKTCEEEYKDLSSHELSSSDAKDIVETAIRFVRLRWL